MLTSSVFQDTQITHVSLSALLEIYKVGVRSFFHYFSLISKIFYFMFMSILFTCMYVYYIHTVPMDVQRGR